MADRRRARLLVATASTSGTLEAGTEVEAGGEFRLSQLQQLVGQGKAEWIDSVRTATATAPERATAPRKKVARRKPSEE